MSITLLLAAVGALALFVCVFAAFSPGGRSGVLRRLETYEEPVALVPRTHIDPLDVFRHGIQATVGKRLDRSNRGNKLAESLARADLKLKPTEWVMISMAIALVTAILTGWRFGGSIIAALVGLVAGYFGAQFFLRIRQSRRTKAFEKQLSPTILAVSSAMKAGYTFAQAIDLVAKNSAAPMSVELGRVIREVQLGVPIIEALGHMVKRNESDDLRLMLTAVQIQSQVGGNLATILDTIEFTIRERIRIKGEIKTLTGQARASGWILIVLPFALGGILMAIAPSYFSPMLHLLPGQIMLGVAGFMLLCGYGIIRKIVNVKI